MPQSALKASSFQDLEVLIETVHNRLSQSDLKQTRCFCTTTLIMHFAERMGFEVRRWEGSVKWFSRKYVEMIDEGYDFESLNELTQEKAKKRGDALRKKGVRVLCCEANEGNPEDLGGHLCVLVRNADQAFFVDPTSYQFRREDINPGGRIYAPSFVIMPIIHDDFEKNNNLFYRQEFTAAVYEYGAVNKYRYLLESPLEKQTNTDINPYRYPLIYKDIEDTLLQTDIFLN